MTSNTTKMFVHWFFIRFDPIVHAHHTAARRKRTQVVTPDTTTAMTTAAATANTALPPPLGELMDLCLSPTELVGMTQAVLKAVCGAKGVEDGGTKEQMVRRLCGPRPLLPPPAQVHEPPPQQLLGETRTCRSPLPCIYFPFCSQNTHFSSSGWRSQYCGSC